MLRDFHIHTTFSFDGRSTVEDHLKKAKELGIGELCFTEHFNPNGPSGLLNRRIPDRDGYFAAIDAGIKNHPECIVRRGVELGLYDLPSCHMAKELLMGWDVDFILMGSHFNHAGRQYWIPEEWNGDSKQKVMEDAMENTLVFVENLENFDVVAHINFFSRACPYADKEIRYSDAPDAIDTVLKAMVERGKGLEVNTSSYGKFGFFMPGDTIVKRYLELGGEVITIGSDAHSADALGSGIKEAREMLKQVGCRYYATFAERKPIFHTL
ncbi:MAG: histidinol-phosphatase HisJ family protein [Clostridiales bacterium]|nr:histidinol-phosphatase HisJ family protein [Clostridiales bacterium]